MELYGIVWMSDGTETSHAETAGNFLHVTLLLKQIYFGSVLNLVSNILQEGVFPVNLFTSRSRTEAAKNPQEKQRVRLWYVLA